MYFADFFKSVGQACSAHPLLIALGTLAVAVSLFIMFDAHRLKKKRARHRWK
jgi:hypothetical protein